jgi:predicted N-acetyltransferase YhbS
VELPAGLVLRTAGPADVPGAARLLTARGDAGDAEDLRLIIGTEGHDGVAVVVDGDRVVSTATLLDEVVHIDGIAVPAGQVELVATDPADEGRGLVRALMAWAHARSRSRGHLLQVMVGIPYFYRQFGYAYVLPMPPWRPLAVRPPIAGDVRVRAADVADIAAMQSLQGQAQAAVDVRMGHTAACWRWLLDRGGSTQRVAERDGAVVGVCRLLPPAEGAAVGELAASGEDVARTLVADAAAQGDGAPGAAPLSVQQRSGVAAALEPFLGPAAGKPDWWYARVERVAPLLRRLAPALQARLDVAGLGNRDHEVLLSSWRAHLRFRIGPSGFTLLAEGGPEQAPVSKGGSGVPPDAIPSLLLGAHGALGLEERLPDCHLGEQRELMAALFPPRSGDLLTFYLPT